MRARLLPFLLIVALAAPAWAQPPVAPAPTPPSKPTTAPAPPPAAVRSLFDQRDEEPTEDEDEPDAADDSRAPPQPQAAPQPPAPQPRLDAPPQVEETGKTADAPPTPRDLAYEARIRSSFASAEGFQGPLDGGWTLRAGGQDLYALQLVDRRDRLEGVWRDVRRKTAIDGAGGLDDIRRQGGGLTLRFTPHAGGPATVANLREAGGGRWTGELVDGGASRPAILRRAGPYPPASEAGR